jgi:hypothetical protein
MYLEEQVRIGKADDGTFIISFRVNRKKDRSSKSELAYDGSDEKTHTATNIDEVKTFLDEILPKLKKGSMEEDDYNEAFGEATRGA